MFGKSFRLYLGIDKVNGNASISATCPFHAPTKFTEAREMTVVAPIPITGPSVWSAQEMIRTDDWIVRLSAEDVTEIEHAHALAKRNRRTGYVIDRTDFPLPHLSRKIDSWIDEIENGRGFLVVRGFPAKMSDEASLYDSYWGLGQHLGEAIIQNYEGRRINEVRSRGHSYDAVNIRAYATASHLGFHNDPSDLTCLLCVRQAKSGGLSRIASAAAIYNDIVVDHPEFLTPLCRGFHHDVRGEGPTGKLDEVTEIAIPVFSHFAGKLSCCLNAKAIATAREKMGGTLSSLEEEALAYIDERAMESDLRFEFMLEPGDILMMNNYTVLHARTAFEDWETPERQRLLLRLWLNLYSGRPLADNFTGRFNTGHRGGAVIHNHTDADLLAAEQ
jgi:alpha-ketoglutarate-dependent taurine dioxygenase